jgi:hypothetical protein
MDPVLEGYLEGIGETPRTNAHAKALPDWRYVLAKRLMFHWTVIEGSILDTSGYDDRWCFETEELALAAIAAWPADPPPGYEPEGWHRHPKTGRRQDNTRQWFAP